jgi:hypothetical protein
MIIHAPACGIFRDELDGVIALAREDEVEEGFLALLDPDRYAINLFPRGAIVAIGNMSDVFGPDADVPDEHPVLESSWADNDAKYWLYFDAIVPVKPVLHKGLVGLFKVPYEVASALEPFPSKSSL